MKGLTEDQKDLLREIVLTETWPAIVRQCELIVEKMAERVLALRADSSELALEKARYEGALSLAKSLENLKQDLKEKSHGRQRVGKAR